MQADEISLLQQGRQRGISDLQFALCGRRQAGPVVVEHPQAEAPHYVNIAHRAALMYAFSAQLLAVFGALSAFPAWLNTVAVIPPLVFFAIAIAHYAQLGLITRWTPVKGLTFSADLAYTMLDQKYASGSTVTQTANNVGIAKPAATYELKDQNSLTLLLRAQRNW